MKKSGLIALFFVLGLFANALKAQTILDFTLVNQTGEDLYGVYVTDSENESWGDDILPNDILQNGYEIEVKFNDDGEVTCNWDIKLTKDASEKTSVTISDVNLCGTTKITLKKANGKYTYVRE